MELYYYEGSTRLGPVNPAQLRALVDRGVITPDTVIEAGSKKLLAVKVKGLEFPPGAPPPVEPQAASAAPVPPPLPPVDPPAAEPKKETKTVLTAFGAATVEVDPAPLPEMPPAGSSSSADAGRRESFDTLEKACVQVTQIGWFFTVLTILAAVGSVFAMVQGFIPGIVTGIASAVSCWVTSQLFFFLGKAGRFLIDWRQRGE